jgi:soluble lytic murein transglycosylase-like protein
MMLAEWQRWWMRSWLAVSGLVGRRRVGSLFGLGMKRFSEWRTGFLILGLALVSALPCWAGEVAVLRNGFSIRHERREVMGNVTRLYVNADGSSYVDVPTAEIEHFEKEEAPPGFAPASSGQAGSSLGANAAGVQAFRQTATVAQKPIELNELVASASGRYRLDPDLVNSVIRAESGFNVRAVSRKGAQGLMQLMPETALKLGVPNAFDPRANVEGGTRYLRELLERYNFDLIKALAAYNAGPQRVEQFGGVPPYYETRAYVARVVRDFNKKKLAQKSAVATQKSSPKKPTTGTHAPATRRQDVTAQAKARPASE